MFMFYLLFYVFMYIVILLLFPSSIYCNFFFCSAGHMSASPKRKVWRSSNYLFWGAVVPFLCFVWRRITTPGCWNISSLVSGWSFVWTHPRHPGYFDSTWFTLKSAWKIFRDLQKPSKNETLSELGTHWWLILGSLVVPRFMKLATLPRLSMQSLRCLDWFCSVIDCRKYPGVCRWMQLSENDGILPQISILF